MLIQREERFAKTSVGWILHDIWKNDHAGVRAFVERNLASISLEALRNALKYAAKAEQGQYAHQFKQVSRRLG